MAQYSNFDRIMEAGDHFKNEASSKSRMSRGIERYICTLLVALIVNLGQTFAHENTIVFKNFGNVKVRIETGYQDEGINKMALWGQLAEKLCKELNYTDTVFLDFGYCRPDFLISFDKGRVESTSQYKRWDPLTNETSIHTPEPKEFLGENALVIRQITSSSGSQAQTTLKLLEYAILNLNHIKSTQIQIDFNKNYCKYRFNSIDTLVIKKMMDTPDSDLVKNMLNLKIYRPEENFGYGISYYWQNNKYFIFQKSYFNKQETVITDIENIYDIKKTGNLSAIIFDTDSSFYYIAQSGVVNFGVGGSGGQQNKPHISQRQVIENRAGYRPFNVVGIGGGKIAISFSYWAEWKEEEDSESTMVGDRERTLIYLTKDDKLIQDLDKLIKKQ